MALHRGQGAFEYILMLSGVLLVVITITYMMQGSLAQADNTLDAQMKAAGIALDPTYYPPGAKPQFMPSSPADGSGSTTRPNITALITVKDAALNSLQFNWNGTNYTIYDPTLVLSLNFDGASFLGENASQAVDNSVYQNNASIPITYLSTFESGFEGWEPDCGSSLPTRQQVTPGHLSTYAYSFQGSGCVYKTVNVPYGQAITYSCKGPQCSLCLWNNANCANTNTCDNSVKADWTSCKAKVTSAGVYEAIMYPAGGPATTIDNFYYGASLTPDGKFGSAIEFDGIDDYASVPYKESLRTGSTFTVSVWIYPRGGGNQVPLSKALYPYGWYWLLNAGGPSSFLRICDQACSSSATFTPIGTWTHATIVHNGTNVIFYKNGVRDSICNGVQPTCGGTGYELLIGKYHGSGYSFNGSIDELRVWNRSLTPAEIEMNFRSNLKKYTPNAWFFDFKNETLPIGTYNYAVYASGGYRKDGSSETRTVRYCQVPWPC